MCCFVFPSSAEQGLNKQALTPTAGGGAGKCSQVCEQEHRTPGDPDRNKCLPGESISNEYFLQVLSEVLSHGWLEQLLASCFFKAVKHPLWLTLRNHLKRVLQDCTYVVWGVGCRAVTPWDKLASLSWEDCTRPPLSDTTRAVEPVSNKMTLLSHTSFLFFLFSASLIKS